MESDGHKLNTGLKEEGTRTPVGIHFFLFIRGKLPAFRATLS